MRSARRWVILLGFVLTACVEPKQSPDGRGIASKDLDPQSLAQWVANFGFIGDLKTDLSSSACKSWKSYLMPTGDKTPVVHTDQIAVVHRGRMRFLWSDGLYRWDSPHSLWSASKSVTATLVGAAIQEGKLKADDPLEKFIPASERQVNTQWEHLYSKITIHDLLYMGANFQWSESYGGDITSSSVLRMFYTEGYKHFSRFALNQPMMIEGPMKRWNYSSGNSNILMEVLKRVYPKERDTFPWRILFDRIGMKDTRFERDPTGSFAGSSYVYSSPEQMAKLGFLYLNDGMWNGKRILPEGWVERTQTISQAQESKLTSLEYIKEEGVYGQGFWLNQKIRELDTPFPKSPKDLYFAAGHYGQLLIMIPSKDLIIARTGHDKEYWSKLDEIISRTVECFAP